MTAMHNHWMEALFREENQVGGAASARILAQWLENPGCTLWFPGISSNPSSELLEADWEEGLLIDSWGESAKRMGTRVGDKVFLWSSHGLAPTGLAGDALGWTFWRGRPALHLAPSSSLYQWQRRAYLRALAPRGSQGQLHRRGARSVPMELVDLGAGGLRCRLQSPRDYPLAPNEWLAGVEFYFAGNLESLVARVCHISGPRRGAKGIFQEMGLSFEGVPHLLQERLVQFALSQEREGLRQARF